MDNAPIPAHPFIEVSVNSVLDYSNGSNIREYSDQYRRVVIRHDNAFRVTELRLIGFIEPDYTIIIAPGTFDYYRIVPDDEDDAMADFTHIRLGAPEAIDKSKERILEELRLDIGALPEDKVSLLVRSAVTDGIPQTALGEEFRYDYCISSLEKYYQSLGPGYRSRFIEHLKNNESSLSELLAKPDFSERLSGVAELTSVFRDQLKLHHSQNDLPDREDFEQFVKQLELASKRMRGKR